MAALCPLKSDHKAAVGAWKLEGATASQAGGVQLGSNAANQGQVRSNSFFIVT